MRYSILLLIPYSQDSFTKLTVAVLVLLVVACAQTWFTKKPWSWGSAVPVTIGAVWMALVTAQLSALAIERVVRAGGQLWDGTVSGRLPQTLDADAALWLLPDPSGWTRCFVPRPTTCSPTASNWRGRT